MAGSKLARAVILAAACCTATARGNSFLAQQALTKVLGDASQVFGVPTAGNATTANWMRRIPDSTPIVHLNIPGTHESATWNFSQATENSLTPDAGVLDPLYYRCQSRSIVDSLDAGVRFFDLRYALDPTDTALVFWHNNALMSERATVESVLFGFYAWLDAHPSEALILSFQYEGGTKPGASANLAVQTQLFGLLTSPAAARYFLPTRDALGTLGAARGKIILFRRFELDLLPAAAAAALPGLDFPPAQWTDDGKDIVLRYAPGTDNTSVAFIEDYYEPDDLPANASSSADAVAAKLAATAAHLAQAAGPANPDSLFLTFVSAERTLADPPVYPETMALGNGSDVTPLGGVNQQLLPVLAALAGQRLGIVVLDFWDQPPELVPSILGL